MQTQFPEMQTLPLTRLPCRISGYGGCDRGDARFARGLSAQIQVDQEPNGKQPVQGPPDVFCCCGAL